MSEQYSVDPQAALLANQVLEAGQIIRTRERAFRRQLAEQAEKAREREGSPEVQLAEEVESLTNRMVWLHEHPKLSRFMGKSAIGIVHSEDRDRFGRRFGSDTLSTAPLTDGEISQLSGEHLLFSGLIAWRFYDKHEKYRLKQEQAMFKSFGVKLVRREEHKLYIDQQVKDETTGAKARRQLYDLRPYSSRTGPRVEVSSSDGKFENYALERRRESIAQYEARNPWAKDWQPEGRGTDIHYPNNGWGRAHPKTLELECLSNELVPNLRPGTSWEYPDEFFLEPLGLVREMNILLGTRNK